MKTDLDQLIEFIERHPPLSDEETRILYKAHLLNHYKKMEDKMYPYKLITPSDEYYADSTWGLFKTFISCSFKNLFRKKL